MIALGLTILLNWSAPAWAGRSCGDIVISTNDQVAALTERFERAWARIGGRNGAEVAADVIPRYLEKHRAYHDLRHLTECLEHLDLFISQDDEYGIDRDLLTVAFAFHDAIYEVDPGRSARNERASADLFVRHANGIAPDRVRAVEGLIMATKSHLGTNAAERVFVDIDLAILGSDEIRFAEFEMGIRAEYAAVPIEVYRIKRAEVLAGFAARTPIYQIPYFRYRFERRAKANLRASADASRIRR